MFIALFNYSKWLLIGAIFLNLFTISTGYSQEIDPIFDRQQWKNRVLVITGAVSEPQYAEQIAALEAVKPGLEERNIIVIRFKDGILKKVPDLTSFDFQFKRYKKTAQQRYLQNRLGTDDDIFSVVLVGLDGERKQVWEDVVDGETLFAVIDAMPMREHELK